MPKFHPDDKFIRSEEIDEEEWKEQQDWKGEIDAEGFPGITLRFKKKKVTTIGGEVKRLLIPLFTKTPMPESIRCKECASWKLYRHGVSRRKHEGRQ